MNIFKKIGTFVLKHKVFAIAAATVVLGVLLTVAYVTAGTSSTENEITVAYTDFSQDLEYGKVESISYGNRTGMTVTLNDGTVYETAYPAYEDFRRDMLEKGVELSYESSSNLPSVDAILMIVLLIAIFVVMGKTMKMQFGSGLSQKTLIQTSTVKFSDVIGQDEIKKDIQFYADLLKNPEKGNELGAVVPRGVLLEGSPGCGKTLIAKAIAGEAGVNFISMAGSSFVEKFVGLGAQRVRHLFKIARKNAPCVVFIDEIDAVGAQRGRSSCSESDQTLNALLTELDGFSSKDGVFVIAATNRADMLDEALVRSGRFDRKITVVKPKDAKVREQLFKKYLENKKVSEDVDLLNISKQVSGFTGADISVICNEASSIALQRGLSEITNDCIEEAIDKKVFGGNRTKTIEERNHDKEVTAYHEAGHATAMYLLGKRITRASIIGTTSGVGGAVFTEEGGNSYMSKRGLEADVQIAYAGRASEEIKFGANEITSGAGNDIQQASKLIANAVNGLGFYAEDNGMLNISTLRDMGITINEEKNAELIIRKSKELYERVKQLLSNNYELVTALAEKLIEAESMSGSEVENLFKSVQKQAG